MLRAEPVCAARGGNPIGSWAVTGGRVPATKSIAEFRKRVIREWLPVFCHDARRQYPLEGFRETSIVVSVEDAQDCMYAIECGLVIDHGGGRYRAARST